MLKSKGRAETTLPLISDCSVYLNIDLIKFNVQEPDEANTKKA
jgi:hypothetical protein